MTQHGRFRARVEGEVNGNVLLRRAQHLALARDGWPERLARQIVAGKIQNSRNSVMRSARDAADRADRDALNIAAAMLATVLPRLKDAPDLNTIRGLEGEAAAIYFGVFNRMLRMADETFTFRSRTRRPPGGGFSGQGQTGRLASKEVYHTLGRVLPNTDTHRFSQIFERQWLAAYRLIGKRYAYEGSTIQLLAEPADQPPEQTPR